MSGAHKAQILLTNDDGIRSPGLWRAAEALSSLGFVTVAAPREQASGSGRSMPVTSDGVIDEERIDILGKSWVVYAVGGTPAQAVQHGVLELMPSRPDLVVAGINYGENIGLGVTISGTVGAALEGAALGIPALAISLEAEPRYHLSYSEEVDFEASAHFACYFGERLMALGKIEDVHVLKVEVPNDATEDTPWEVARLSRARYYAPVAPERDRLDMPAKVGYKVVVSADELEPGTDSYVLHVKRRVAVTPLSLDLSSRVDLQEFKAALTG
jgi:5'-nucleotidase